MTDQPKETFWSKAWAFIRKYILAPLPVLLIAAGAVVLVMLGAKNIQVGGLIGAISGKKKSKKAIDVANSVPEKRVREDGTIIQPGETDSKGITQAKVVPIKTPGLFDDPKKVKISDPETGEDIEVDVPDGVKASDVDKVVVVSPEVHVVTVKSTSPVEASDIDDLLKKYGDY